MSIFLSSSCGRARQTTRLLFFDRPRRREATFRRQRKLDCGQTSQLFSLRDAGTSALCVYDEIFSSYTVLSIAARAFLFAFFCAPPGFFTRARHFSRISE